VRNHRLDLIKIRTVELTETTELLIYNDKLYTCVPDDLHPKIFLIYAYSDQNIYQKEPSNIENINTLICYENLTNIQHLAKKKKKKEEMLLKVL
jgi:hypothetical protein